MAKNKTLKTFSERMQFRHIKHHKSNLKNYVELYLKKKHEKLNN